MQIGKGARIRLIRKLDDKWTRLDVGSEGTVNDITDVTEVAGLPFRTALRQIWISWDSGSRLALLSPQDDDKFEYWFPYRGNNKK